MEYNLSPLEQIAEAIEKIFIHMHTLIFITHDGDKIKTYSLIFLYL